KRHLNRGDPDKRSLPDACRAVRQLLDGMGFQALDIGSRKGTLIVAIQTNGVCRMHVARCGSCWTGWGFRR
ncbi:hypothetical protein CQA77_30415, partial [Klebsiella pneumoniae]